MKLLDALLVEMVTIGYNLKFGEDIFKVAIHGPSYDDSENPHIQNTNITMNDTFYIFRKR